MTHIYTRTHLTYSNAYSNKQCGVSYFEKETRYKLFIKNKQKKIVTSPRHCLKQQFTLLSSM